MEKTMLRQEQMSEEECAKESSAVISYNLNKPMSWAEFKQMPEDLQREYLKKLTEFRVNAPHIASMFHIADQSLRKKASVLGVRLYRKKATLDDISAFAIWAHGDLNVSGESEITVTVQRGQRVKIVVVSS